MDALDDLRRQLDLTNANTPSRPFEEARKMKETAAECIRKFGDGVAPATDLILKAVQSFIRTGKVQDFRSLKLLCYGAALRPAPSVPAVLENEPLLTRLLAALEGVRAKIRQFRRCYQALLSVFLSFPLFQSGGTAGFGGWTRLRGFLTDHQRHLTNGQHQPAWVTGLREHANVLQANPCAKYASEFLQGSRVQFESMCEQLSVSRSSWLRDQVVLDAVKATMDLPEAQFRQHVDFLLDALCSAPNVRLAGLRQLLNHYASLEFRPEHPGLRTTALAEMGNPLLVVNGQRWKDVSSAAQQMVADWLKLAVIHQFFELLSHDAVADQRRLRFWSKYASSIENLWIVFGAEAFMNSNRDFRELRGLLGDHGLQLEAATRTNNAFIMKIGSRHIIEFSETGNAAYVYAGQKFPFASKRVLHLRNDLKRGDTQLLPEDRSLTHVDTRAETWEDKFRRKLTLSSQPAAPLKAVPVRRPQETASPTTRAAAANSDDFKRRLNAFCAQHGLQQIDGRRTGEPLTVYADTHNPTVAATLAEWGFLYNIRMMRWERSN